MEFTLIYKGNLPTKASPKIKQEIRRDFHRQLKKLWSLGPLKDYTGKSNNYLDEKNPQTFIHRFGDFKFAPLVNKKFDLIAEVKIILLRSEPPGLIVTQGGDIDNRLKILFDSLQMPRNIEELPSGDSPQEDEDPFFCLLEDDKLITKVSVETDTLLDPTKESSYVELLVRVKTKATRITYGNIGLS